MENEKLVERLESIMKHPDKLDLPGANPYEKKRPKLDEYLKSLEESKDPVLAYDLDDYGIRSLKDIKVRQEVEEISLMGNKIEDPNNITEILMKLPNLRGLWMNGNPCEENCSNFNIIGNHFSKLEVFNSQLTSKAGEWTVLRYARDQGAKALEDIVSLDFSGKNILTVTDISFLKKLTNMKTFDIGNNVDMYKPREMLEKEARQKAEGSG